jgi:hypothetical protein
VVPVTPVGPVAPVMPVAPVGPVLPVGPCAPTSPVRAKVMITSSALVKDVAEPETYPQSTVKYPVSSVMEEIVNNAKSVESALLEILKWPFIVLVESSIVLKNDWMSVVESSWSSMNNFVAVVILEASNFSFPTPGSLWVIFVSNV